MNRWITGDFQGSETILYDKCIGGYITMHLLKPIEL